MKSLTFWLSLLTHVAVVWLSMHHRHYFLCLLVFFLFLMTGCFLMYHPRTKMLLLRNIGWGMVFGTLLTIGLTIMVNMYLLSIGFK